MKGQVLQLEQLGSLTRIARGGQGVVYRTQKGRTKFAASIVYKEYKAATAANVDFQALSAMSALVEEQLSRSDAERLLSLAAWPCAIVEVNSTATGFVMPSIPESFFIPIETVKGTEEAPAEFQHLLNDPDFLAARGIALDNRQRLRLISEVAAALAFLHHNGICVGDISPKNLLFSLHPRPAVYFVDCDTMRINGTSALPQVETPGWEVPAGEELATAHSDTYKLGLLALRLLVGDQDVVDPERLPPTTPNPLRRIITDTLTNQPATRPISQAWDYILKSAIEESNSDEVSDPRVRATQKKPTPAPDPILRSRPSSTPPKAKKKPPTTPPTTWSPPYPHPTPSGSAPLAPRINTTAKITLGAAASIAAGVLIAVAVNSPSTQEVTSPAATGTVSPSTTPTPSGPQILPNATETNEATDRPGAASADTRLVGPGCTAYTEQVPDGPGSVVGMAASPLTVAASNSPVLTTLAAAISGGLNSSVNLVEPLDGGDFTVFAPTNDAFAKIDSATIEMLRTDADLLTAILTYHVVPGQAAPEQVVGTHRTLYGADLTVSGRGEYLYVNAANIVCGGIKTANATVYMIDSVLLPPAASTPTP